ncbi:MAG: hypothetical protein CSA72_02155 [Rhodobacterales bacterium]|nr:MAG: hypothetical protein CSA72_02155 [Rhodobacterales bacterium]
MATYNATLMHGERGGEGKYTFEAEDGLIDNSAMSTVRRFMEHLTEHAGLGPFEWQLNAAMKNKEKHVVTALGVLVLHGDEEPFVCFINEA